MAINRFIEDLQSGFLSSFNEYCFSGNGLTSNRCFERDLSGKYEICLFDCTLHHFILQKSYVLIIDISVTEQWSMVVQ